MARTKTRKMDAPRPGSGLGRFSAKTQWFDTAGGQRRDSSAMAFGEAFEKATKVSSSKHMTRAQIRAKNAGGRQVKPAKGSKKGK